MASLTGLLGGGKDVDWSDVVGRRVSRATVAREPLTFEKAVNKSIDKQITMLKDGTWKTASKPKSWFNDDKKVLSLKPANRTLNPAQVTCQDADEAIQTLELLRQWETNPEVKSAVEAIRAKWSADVRIKNKSA